MQVDNTCFPAQKERQTAQVAILSWSSSFTTSTPALNLGAVQFYNQRKGIYLAFNECVIECLSTGSINLNCVWLYTVCLVESRSILGHIWSLYYCLKRCSQDSRNRVIVCKVEPIQMISHLCGLLISRVVPIIIWQRILVFLPFLETGFSSSFALGSSIIFQENELGNNPVYKAVSVKASHGLFGEDHLVSVLYQNVALLCERIFS